MTSELKQNTSTLEETQVAAGEAIALPPRGLGILLAIGPGLVWCGEYIGSGEVILSTRSGAIFGVAILWVPALAIFAKYWIGLAGAHYTVTTGEGMIDMISRTPGPRNWVVWPVFIGQVCSAAISTAAIASAAGWFAAYFIPLPQFLLGWIAALAVIALTWRGTFEPVKRFMSLLVLFIIIGACAVAFKTWPGTGEVVKGMTAFAVPAVPQWAVDAGVASRSSWSELLPLLGWAAGGFASQVWYSYWVLGAGYGMAKGRAYGEPLDASRLRRLTARDAESIRGWRKMVTVDATVALVIGVIVTGAFMMAGSGVLGPLQIVPQGDTVAMELSRIFGEQWGAVGAGLFALAGLAAMMSTMIGQFAGWPRLLADCGRLLFPRVARVPWKTQFRAILVLLAATNLLIVYTFGVKPVFLVQISAVLDGLILTPLQALAVGLTLFLVMPKLFGGEVRETLKANNVLAVGLALAFAVYGYFCVVEIPKLF